MNEKQTIENILHGLITAGIVAASVFVKNPNSREHAAQLIQLTNTTLIPLADSILNQQGQAGQMQAIQTQAGSLTDVGSFNPTASSQISKIFGLK